MAYQITTQKELRRCFWECHPELSRKRGRCGDYPTDTRVAWCDYVEWNSRDGTISQELAQRATLD